MSERLPKPEPHAGERLVTSINRMTINTYRAEFLSESQSPSDTKQSSCCGKTSSSSRSPVAPEDAANSPDNGGMSSPSTAKSTYRFTTRDIRNPPACAATFSSLAERPAASRAISHMFGKVLIRASKRAWARAAVASARCFASSAADRNCSRFFSS
jgi:hypothetical protein